MALQGPNTNNPGLSRSEARGENATSPLTALKGPNYGN